MKHQIFISYRRAGGETDAKLICVELEKKGYTVFYDHDGLKGGTFDTVLYDEIENCNDFVLVLPPQALDRCWNEDDWVRKEIHHALTHKKNIIPVMLKGFEFPKQLPSDISAIGRYNGVRFDLDYFKPSIAKIIERLKSKPIKKLATLAALAGGLLAMAVVACSLLLGGSNIKLFCSHKYNTSLTAPTCTEQGYTTYLCSECGKTEKKDYVPATGHDWAEVIYETAPTCTAPGYGTKHCSVCDAQERSSLAAKGHSYTEWVVDQEATPTENGHRYKICTVCEDLVEEVLHATGSEGLAFTKVESSYAVTGIGSCTAEEIVIPSSFDGLPVTTIANDAFKDCRLITSVKLPEGITSIGNNAFKGCVSLVAIDLPAGLTALGDSAFEGCKSLENIQIPSGITRIKKHCFDGCVSLSSITLPKSIEKFEAYCFNGCGLEHVYYEGTKILWHDIAVGGGCYQSCGNFVVHCSDTEFKIWSMEGIFG